MLDLSGNLLRQVPAKIFEPLANLNVLILENIAECHLAKNVSTFPDRNSLRSNKKLETFFVSWIPGNGTDACLDLSEEFFSGQTDSLKRVKIGGTGFGWDRLGE